MASPRLILGMLLAAGLARSSAPTFGAEAPEHPDRRQPYQGTIPHSNVTFEMVPIPGGTFRIGSPESERGRKKDEGPQIG
jgi:formylglycine-generating enzyme required for sulfatase activity